MEQSNTRQSNPNTVHGMTRNRAPTINKKVNANERENFVHRRKVCRFLIWNWSGFRFSIPIENTAYNFERHVNTDRQCIPSSYSRSLSAKAHAANRHESFHGSHGFVAPRDSSCPAENSHYLVCADPHNVWQFFWSRSITNFVGCFLFFGWVVLVVRSVCRITLCIAADLRERLYRHWASMQTSKLRILLSAFFATNHIKQNISIDKLEPFLA